MNFYYENSKGEIIRFNDFPYLFQDGDLIDTSWQFDENNGRLVNFSKGIGERSFQLAVLPDYTLPIDERKAALKSAADHIYEVFDYDIINGVCGKLYSDTGYYLLCQVVSSTKSDWNNKIPYMFQTFKIKSEVNWWLKENNIIIAPESNIAKEMEVAIDYPYDYEHDYGFLQTKITFDNNSFSDSDFIMKIQGEVNTPIVYINDHMYSVDVTLSKGDILEINSRNYTIKLIKSNGEVTNCFDLRNRDSYIFQKIAVGVNSINITQNLNIMLTYFDERGEPKWS